MLPALAAPSLAKAIERTKLRRELSRVRAADAVCRACHAAPKDAVNEPCGHVLHCARCAAKLAAANGGVCPECAAPATLGGMTTVKTCDICFDDVDAAYLYAASDARCF
jgi:hypothetical protein